MHNSAKSEHLIFTFKMNPSNKHGEENGGHYFNQLIIVNITNEGRNQNRAPEVMH